MPFNEICSPAQCPKCPLMVETGTDINRIKATPNPNDTTTVTLLHVDPRSSERYVFGSFHLPGGITQPDAAAFVEARADIQTGPIPTRKWWGKAAVACCITVSDKQFSQHVEQVEVTAQALAPEPTPNQAAA
ncbi:MAG: hypothetical protein WBP26_03210 [Candidatus Saccharimonadales bacterium]